MAVLKRVTKFITSPLCRNIQLSSVKQLNKNQVKEVQIPVPWGHIAGKYWGDENKKPILALHGWQDNAGTFDAMMEHFPSTIPVLAIDFPGHGLSSHIPQGQLYYNMLYSTLIRRIQKHYNWDKVTILGHSLGIDVSVMFSAMYPDDVDCLIGLDIIMPFMKTGSPNLGKMIDSHLANMFRSNESNFEYTADEIISRWIKGTNGSLNKDSVAVLMKRGTKKNPQSGKFSFTRDHRLKGLNLTYVNREQGLNFIKRLKCHYLVFRFTQNSFFPNSEKIIPDVVDIVKSTAKSFELHLVEGTHHAHMHSPELIVPTILKFLEKVE